MFCPSAGVDYFDYRPASFIVRELTFLEDGSVATLRVAFEIATRLYGEIRFHASPPAPAPNLAPLVGAGEDITIPNRGVAVLNSYATDDSVIAGRRLASRWSVVSGPGKVQFGKTASGRTKATFSMPGTYVLRLTANDGKFPVSDEVTVTQTSELTSVWLQGDSGDWLLNDKSVFLTWREGVISAEDNPNTVAITYESYSGVMSATTVDQCRIRFFAPNGGRLEPGVYANVADIYTLAGPPSPARLDITINNRGSRSHLASFHVYLAEYDDEGKIQKFWASFSHRGETSTGNLSGEIRYQLAPEDVVNVASNQPPIVTAGTPGTVGRSATLTGWVTDDGLPLTKVLSSRWNVVSGPGVVTFADASSPTTPVEFSLPGDYVLRLAATDGETTAFEDLPLTVTADSGAVTVKRGNYAGAILLQKGPGLHGAITVTINSGRSFSSTILAGIEGGTFTGVFSAAGKWTGTVSTSGPAPLTVSLAITPSGQITGTVSDGTMDGQILLEPEVTSFTYTDWAPGKYTFALLQESSEADTPPGHGYGTLRVSDYGLARCQLIFPDGTKASSGDVLTVNKMIPIHTTLARQRGYVIGQVKMFHDVGIADPRRIELGGELTWVKGPKISRTSASPGFAATLNLTGSRFSPSGYHFPSLLPGMSHARIRLDNPTWGTGLGGPLLLPNKPGKITPPPGGAGITSFSLGSTGLFQGKYRDESGTRSGRFGGAILQDRRTGYGYSKDDAGSTGTVEIRPYP